MELARINEGFYIQSPQFKREMASMRNNFLILLVICIALSGCATKGMAYDEFNKNLESLSGKPIQQAYLARVGYLRDAIPDSILKLENNNVIWVFNVSRTYKFPFNSTQKATIYIEVNTSKQIVVQASCRGDLCWRSI